MAVDVSRIPNNNKFDPVREAILQLQSDVTSGVAGVGTINSASGNITITDSGNITVNTVGTTITIGIDDTDYFSLSDTGTQTITGNVVISGNLTVNGTTVYLNTETVRVEDNIIELNRTPDTPNDTATATTSGIEIYRGNGVTTASFIFDDTDDTWDLTNNLAVAGTITTGGNEVITLGDLSITTSATPSGGGALSYDDTTGVFTFTPADAGTGLTLQQVTANGNTTNYGISTGNITVQPSGTGSGVVTIQANSVGDARLDLTAGTGGTGVIKTTNDVAITFEPNATEKVVIASDGNMNVYEKLAVGKTTAASTYHLEVDGTALANNFITSMTASGTTYTGTVSQYYNALQIRTATGGTISLGGSGPLSVQNNVAIKDGDLDVNGDVTADFFIGDGSQLTNISGANQDLDDVTTNGATTTNDISTGRITIANNVSTGGFTSFDDYQILLYKSSDPTTSYGLGIESNTMMFHSNDNYRFYVDNAIKVTINSSGNISATSFTGDGSGLTSVDADTLDGYQLSGTSSVSDKIFNNKGVVHSTFTDFNTVMNAGANYLQAGTNGPTGTENHQWYGFMLGLGSDYNTTTGNANGYASQIYWNRQSQGGNAYLWARDLEAGTWGSWRKMSAGNADNADTLNGVAGSSFLRSDADDTATGKITINNNSNSINDPTLTITSSQGGGSFGRLMFSGTSTVAGVINRGVSGSHLYFDEDATTGDYHFRSSGRAYYYGNLTVGSTNDTEGKLVVRGDANSGMVSFFKNLDTGTTAYAEVIVRSVDSNNDLRIGTSKNYTDTEWQGGWVFAPRSLKLKSNNDVNIFAGGTGNDSIIGTFTSSLISLNTNTEVTGKITITGSPAIELTGSGTGTYNKTVIYNDQTYGFLLEATKATNSGSAAKKPITLTWRGGFNSNGGINLTGDTKLVTTDTGLGIDTTTPSAKLHVEGSSIIANNTAIDPDSYANKVVAGAIADGSGWALASAVGGNAGAGRSWAVGVSGSQLFMGLGDGTNANSLQTFLNVSNRNLRLVPDSGNVSIGTNDAPMKLTVRGGFIALNSSNGSSASALYISPTNENTFNSGYGQDIDDKDMWLNYRGYNDGFTRFRDVRIGNGKGTAFAFFQGSTQRVGIGTTSPSAKLNTNLSVEGSILAYLAGTSYTFDGDANIAVTHNSSTMGTGTAAGLLLANNNNSNNAISPLIAFSARSASNGYNHTYAAIYGQKRASGADSNWNRGDLIFATANSTGPQERMRILDGGNVGIGTTSPSEKLEVNGTIASIASSYPTIKVQGSDVNYQGRMRWDTNNNVLEFLTRHAGTYYGDTLVLNQGNVGVGTNSPSAKLDVNGIIKAGGNQVNPQEYGVSMVGNFGQWQGHGTYNNFNTVPAYWGWNYIQGNTNAPNSNSSQWYRGRFSLGDQYGLGTSSGDYWMEIAVPRYNYAGGDAGQMFVRACEDGVEGSWYQVGRKIIGDFTATGDVVAYGSSDRRLKDNITPIPNALDKVNSIGGYEFDWNDNQETYEGHDVGVIAQEVEEVMPEVVTTREDGYKAVKYEKLVPLLIEAIKEQQKQIDELKARLDA